MTQFFKWGASEALIWLLLLIPLALIGWRAIRLRVAAMRRFCPSETGKRLQVRPLAERLALKSGLALLGVALVVCALARPQVGLQRERAVRQGSDIMLVMDTSMSMLAQDEKPNRLEAAKNAAALLVNRLSAERFGVVVFAGEAHLYCPVTVDHEAVVMFIESIEEGIVPRPGSLLAPALETAAANLQTKEGRHSAIVLFTDSEDHGSEAVQVAQRLARENSIYIEVIAFGTPEGEPIPLIDPAGRVRGFKTDRGGQMVLTKMDEKLGQEIAQAGQGGFVQAQKPGALEEVASRLETLEGATEGQYVYTHYGERFQWILLLALIILVLEACLPERPRRRNAAGGEEEGEDDAKTPKNRT